MLEIHIVLRSVLPDGSHEQIDILDCGIANIEDGWLVIYASDDKVVSEVMGRFLMPEIIGYWIEES